jgi:type I restriction enzyme, R subunit
MFADPDFDGDPVLITEEEMNEAGENVSEKVISEEEVAVEPGETEPLADEFARTGEEPPRKYYADNGWVEITAHLVYELDPDGKQLRVVKFTDYTADKVRDMYTSAATLRRKWSNAEERAEIIKALEDRGISFDELADAAKQPDADPFDLLCPSHSMHPFARAGSEPRCFVKRRRIFSSNTLPRRARRSTRCWKSISSMALRNFRFPTF